MGFRIATIIAALVFSAGAAQASSFARNDGAPVGAPTSVPYGWVDFCQRYRGECDGTPEAPRAIVLTERARADLERVNRTVNKAVQSVTDLEHWGVIDRWDYPTDGKGDCEDFVLQKRKMLARLGYPVSALLVAVVRDLNDEGHAVLLVKTDQGDFALDNMRDDILPWSANGYRYVKRQAQYDPNVWLSILPQNARLAAGR